MNQHSSPEKQFDSRAFRRCLGQFGTGVTVVTSEVEGQKVGVTANSFSSLSLDPPLVLWSIARSSRAFAAFVQADRFCISILADDQIALSQRFSNKDGDRFAAGGWNRGSNGIPVIDGSAAILECSTESTIDGGDHVIIVGRVTHFATGLRNPLIFSQGRYCIGVDHPNYWEQARDIPTGSNSHAATVGDSLGTLVFDACNSWRTGFDSYRRSTGLTPLTGRILYVLSRYLELNLPALAKRADLPAQEVEDEIGRLIQSGDVEAESHGTFKLTRAGLLRREVLKQKVITYENQALDGIPSNDVAITKKTLVRYLKNASAHSAPD